MPLAQVARVTFASAGRLEIQRYQEQRTVTVSSDVRTGRTSIRSPARCWLRRLAAAAGPPSIVLADRNPDRIVWRMGMAIAIATSEYPGGLPLESGT
ncbi:MAG: hypothetical protein R2882_07535 [Gemmatimonadales bacterium]